MPPNSLPQKPEVLPPENDKPEASANENPRRKALVQARNDNDRLQDRVNQAEGKEQKEELKPIDRFRELFKREMSVSMEQELGINIYTNVEQLDAKKLQSFYDIIQRSRAFVSSHTAASISQVFNAQLRRAIEAFTTETNDPNVKNKVLALPEIVAQKNADPEKLAEWVKEVMLEMLKTVEEALEKRLTELGIDPKKGREERLKNGETLLPVDPVPSDSNLTTESRNAIRNFRNSIYETKTKEDIKYRDIAERGPKDEKDRAATKEFNKVTELYNDAIKQCVTGNAAEKNARAGALSGYAKTLTGTPMEKADAFMKFADWLKQNPDATKAKAGSATV